ncbi:hypothetical protein ASZ90_016954 [hydrocarbon metagenome]|uniref:Cytochrome b561 domain-containing protein n=1 Tax=hydrocarbon metagenome TaxID=938273 RepID=A0A0W8EAX6_9ZZZZ
MRMFGILTLILLVSLGGVAAAHPPSRMQLTYQEQTGELEVDISHDVADPTTHFVQAIVIRKNGVVLSEEMYTSQPSGDRFTYRYPVVLSPGDEVTAGADCNLFGTITARIMIPGTTVAPPPAPVATPLWVYHALLLVTGFAFIIIAGLLPVYGKRIAGWYRLHVGTAIVGSIFALTAIGLVFRTSSLAPGTSVFSIHVLLGLLLLITLLAALVLALVRNLAGARKAALRKVHIRAGRIFIVLVVVNILLGLAAVGLI